MEVNSRKNVYEINENNLNKWRRSFDFKDFVVKFKNENGIVWIMQRNKNGNGYGENKNILIWINISPYLILFIIILGIIRNGCLVFDESNIMFSIVKLETPVKFRIQ